MTPATDELLTLKLIHKFQDRIQDLRLGRFTMIEDAAAEALPQHFRSETFKDGKIQYLVRYSSKGLFHFRI